MNVGLFTESYKPYLSGVTVAVATLAEELEKLNHRTYIFAPRYPGHTEDKDGVFRFRSISARVYPSFRLAIPFSRKILPQIPRLKLDIIHSHSPYQLGLLARRQARKLRLPFVYTLHTLFSEYAHYVPLISPRITRPLIRRYVHNFCNRADCVIVPTLKIKELLLRDKVTSRVEVVPTGINLEEVAKADPAGVREKYSIPADVKLLIFVGRISKEKNIPFLLESFKQISQFFPEARLLMVGGGPREKDTRRLAEKMRLPVTFTGQLHPAETLNLLKAADIFVFSSLTETQGLVLAEAKAAGLPIVAVAAHGVVDMVKDGEDGFLVPPRPDVFAAKVLVLLRDDALRDAMAYRAAKNALEFSASVSTHKVMKIYQSLIK